MVFMATKIVLHIHCIIVDQNTKYGEDWAEIWAEIEETTVRSCFMQEYYE